MIKRPHVISEDDMSLTASLSSPLLETVPSAHWTLHWGISLSSLGYYPLYKLFSCPVFLAHICPLRDILWRNWWNDGVFHCLSRKFRSQHEHLEDTLSTVLDSKLGEWSWYREIIWAGFIVISLTLAQRLVPSPTVGQVVHLAWSVDTKLPQWLPPKPRQVRYLLGTGGTRAFLLPYK